MCHTTGSGSACQGRRRAVPRAVPRAARRARLRTSAPVRVDMSFDPPPAAAAWLHRGARLGYEVVFFHDVGGGLRIDGCTTATEEGQMWAVSYVINTDSTWTTRSAQITARSASGSRQITLEADGAGHWLAGGETAPSLDG